MRVRVCSAVDGDSILNRVDKGYFEKKIPAEGSGTTRQYSVNS